MYTDVVSITDLRTQTAKVLHSLKMGVKYVFVNNKPQAVLLSPAEYAKFEQLKQIQEIKDDVKYTKKNGKKYKTTASFMKK
jgi:hypothetical protein